jgi:A/G-specific adenine glycosylase
MAFNFPPEKVSLELLNWYGLYGRDLPWRQTRDPYRIWLSEIMLQQTTVAAVIPYYERFLGKFPDVQSLAKASQETVLELWSGLGYYSRARNLHQAAIDLVEKSEGRFPETVDELLQLPGVGRSTAGAIVSIAFNRPAPILDGNVRRVLARLMALTEPPRDSQSEKKLWSWATAFTSSQRPHDYAQAIMDLGATVCLPRQPRCPECPLQDICQAKKQGLENELPVKKQKAKVATRRQVVLVADCLGKLLVRRRPTEGLLGGMWEFPCQEVNDSMPSGAVLQDLQSNLPVDPDAVFVGEISHTYSHFHLQAAVYRVRSRSESKIAENGAFWHDAGELAESPLHGAHQKVLKLILKEDENE